MNGFTRYETWMSWLKEIPVLHEEKYGIIARAIILTNCNFEKVEFITGATKTDVFQVYKWLNEKCLFNLNDTTENDNNKIEGDELMSMTTVNNKRPERTFTRGEMVDFTKKKLIKSNSGIKFVGLKRSILTCSLNDKTFTVYISSSRDYESMMNESDLNSYRVAAWNKGSSNIFSSCDYYALLVKADKETSYTTEFNNMIEGLFVSQNELNIWIGNKVALPSGMINFGIHYTQVQSKGRVSIKVMDNRENSPILLDSLYGLGWKIR